MDSRPIVVAVDFCRLYYQTQTLHGCAEAAACYAAGYGWPNQSDASAAQGRGPAVEPDSDAARIQAALTAAVAEGATLNPPLQTGNVQLYATGLIDVEVHLYAGGEHAFMRDVGARHDPILTDLALTEAVTFLQGR